MPDGTRIPLPETRRNLDGYVGGTVDGKAQMAALAFIVLMAIYKKRKRA